MRFGNARQAIHDAFAIHLTTPDRNARGGTKFDSNAAIFNGMKAGLVIKAVAEQPAHLRGIALLVNAPEGAALVEEIVALKTKLWKIFRTKHQFDLQDEAEVAAVLEMLILGFKKRAWNHSSETLSPTTIANMITKDSAKRERVTENLNRMLDIIGHLDTKALQPVWQVIEDQREKRDAAADRATA